MPASDHERVVLVDSADTQIGVLDKMEAHRRGTLHRAFSVSISDGKGRLLLQKRARGKYHSGSLWTNTCGHPRPGEDVLAAARRRLMEEMGFDCPLEPLFRTSYRAGVSNGLGRERARPRVRGPLRRHAKSRSQPGRRLALGERSGDCR